MRALRMLVPALVLALLFSASASYAEFSEATMLEQATSHYQKGSYYIATTWLERILTTYPRSPKRPEILVMIAKCYASTWREDKAAQTIRTLLKYHPKEAVALDPTLLKLVEADPYGEPERGPELWAPPPEPKAVKAAPAPATVQEEKPAAPVDSAVTQPAQTGKTPMMTIPGGRARVREREGLGPVGMDDALKARVAKEPVALPAAPISGAAEPSSKPAATTK